jgi:hypothetical protein
VQILPTISKLPFLVEEVREEEVQAEGEVDDVGASADSVSLLAWNLINLYSPRPHCHPFLFVVRFVVLALM